MLGLVYVFAIALRNWGAFCSNHQALGRPEIASVQWLESEGIQGSLFAPCLLLELSVSEGTRWKNLWERRDSSRPEIGS